MIKNEVNSELFILTYGSLVQQLIKDLGEQPELINAKLDKM